MGAHGVLCGGPMGRAVGAVWGTQLLVSRVFARSFVYKVHFGVFSRAFSDDFHDENKLATSILAERGGGVQIPCFTLPINFASKWPASVAFGRLSPCVRGEKPKHLRKTHTQNFFWRSESPRYTRYTYASDKVCCARDRVFRALKVLAASEYTRSKTSSGLGGQG
jgi:hypothetical protein